MLIIIIAGTIIMIIVILVIIVIFELMYTWGKQKHLAQPIKSSTGFGSSLSNRLRACSGAGSILGFFKGLCNLFATVPSNKVFFAVSLKIKGYCMREDLSELRRAQIFFPAWDHLAVCISLREFL